MIGVSVGRRGRQDANEKSVNPGITVREMMVVTAQPAEWNHSRVPFLSGARLMLHPAKNAMGLSPVSAGPFTLEQFSRNTRAII